MTNQVVNGTFSGTGPSSTITGHKFDIFMNFAGTASVDIEVLMPSGTWLKLGTSVTADNQQVAEFAADETVRLNCTAHTNNVEYLIKRGENG